MSSTRSSSSAWRVTSARSGCAGVPSTASFPAVLGTVSVAEETTAVPPSGWKAATTAGCGSPGGSSAIHRHNAHAFVYVLEGSVVMQLKGGQQVTLTPGQSFYEGPDDVHLVDRNASDTQPAKFLVLLIKDKGAPALVPAQ